MPMEEWPEITEDDELAMNNILSALRTIKLALLVTIGSLAIGYGIYESVNKSKLPDNTKALQIQNSPKTTEPILP